MEACAMHDFNAMNAEDELPFKKGALLKVGTGMFLPGAEVR